MNFSKKFAGLFAITLLLSVSFTGCAMFQREREPEVVVLQKQVSELEKAQKELELQLKKEIRDREVKVEMLEKGLVITFVSEVLFDSGKAEIRKDSFEKLDKIAKVVNTTVSDLNVGIEGHTDNQPIKYSGWPSNWELSAARAMSVLHYLVDNQQVDPTRLSAIAYGEYHPVSDNALVTGRQKNRRVEIVILPKTVKEIEADEASSRPVKKASTDQPGGEP